MKLHTYTLPKRIVAMILSMVMVLSVTPVLNFGTKAVGVDTATIVADSSTMNEWQSPFLPNGLPSTDYAGAIWTDKSVMTAGSALPGGVSVDENGFLIALSALATNSQVVGKGNVPTDTVFVLDISNSMDGTALSGMVAAVNNAIRTLMEENTDSRIGVVLYSSANMVTTILPLDHYTGATSSTVTTPTYLTYISATDYITTGIGTYTQNNYGGGPGGSGGPSGPGNNGTYSITGPTNSAGAEVEARVQCTGGTYIQGGLWEALENHFQPVTDTQNRVPAIILMSDGAPTYTTNSFDEVNENSNTHGAANASYNGDGFVTQLTAAYVKAKVAEKYGKCLMYTVGFGLDSIDDLTEKAIATKVLDSDIIHTGIDNLWKTYHALPQSGSMTVYLGANTNDLNNPYTVSATVNKSATVLDQNYADGYFAAANASDLNDAFQNIVNEIALQTGYYPTRTDDNGINYSGYITFADRIGSGMEVKEIKGILLDGQLYDGHRMAQVIWQTDQNIQYLENGGSEATLPYAEWLGTMEEPTALGDEFVRAVKTRMGITADTTEAANAIAWELIGNAWTTGQLSYTDENNFSNYIGWYGDAAGNYAGPYTAGGTAPAGAAYINFCYGMLGASDAFGLDSDMMYVTVQISQNIQTGEQIVTFRIPAAMLPTLTYRINVELDDEDNVIEDTATISVNDASPIVLLYEVGVDETKVTPLTVQDYGTPTGDGRYYLYTNAWKHDAATLDDHTSNDLTYAHFEPGPSNEHYYFSQDMLLYVKSGESFVPYTGTTAPTTGVYVADVIYTATGTATDGVYKANVHTDYVLLADKDLAETLPIQKADGWYMPAGAMYANSYNYDLAKANNATGTFGDVHHHIVEATATQDGYIHYELMYQGNNGRLTYAPAQGITLTKELTADAVSLENESFTFTVTVTGDADNTVTLTQGGVSTPVMLDSNNQMTVTLAAGETVTIWDMDTGATYTVTELQSSLYTVAGITVNGRTETEAAGTVTAYTLTPVVFTNDEIHYSAFTVTKRVEYRNGTAAVAGALAKFKIDIVLENYGNQTVLVNNEPKTTDSTGKLDTLEIQDGQTITISQVPVGTAYTVTEQAPAADSGYKFEYIDEDENVETPDDGTGVVTESITGMTVHNSYTPTQITPDPEFAIIGTKTVVDGTGAETDWHGNEFTIRLQRWDAATSGWVDVPNGTEAETVATVTENKPTYSLPLTAEYTQVDTYWYRIVEDEDGAAGITYDTTRKLFSVVVTDNDLDGKLEMTVEEVQNTQVTGPVDNVWTVTANFQNIYDLEDAVWTPTALKTLSGRSLAAGEFTFRLEAVTAGAPMPAVAEVKNGQQGYIVFSSIIFTQSHLAAQNTYQYKLTEIKPATNALGGVDYDTAEYIITVTLKADGDAVAIDTVTYTKDGQPYTDGVPVFANTYQADSVVAGPFTANKTLYNRTPGAAGYVTLTGNEFSFRLQANASADPMPEGAVDGELILQNGPGGVITIPSITYTEAGEYLYTLTEVNGGVGGYTYDTAEYTIIVTVTDPGTGKLEISSTAFMLGETTAVNTMTFANYYRAEATGSIPLGGTKVFNIADKNLTRALTDGEFTFVLTGENGYEQKVTNEGNRFTFAPLQFDHAGTYTYTVTEQSGTAGGVGYDDTVHTLVIQVKDNGQGQLVATANVDIDNLQFTFTNSYDVSDAVLPLTATKTMTGRQPLHGEFTFVLTAVTAGAPMPANATVQNGYRGLVDFGTITYTKAGVYQYTVQETKGNVSGVTYDETVYTVTVTVTDDEKGALTAAITGIQGNAYNDLIFRNVYKASPVKTGFTASKILTNLTPGANPVNMAVNAGDFSFKLTAKDGAPMPSGVTGSEHTFANGAEGVITVPEITYSSVGTYVYTLEEVPGTTPGYTYSNLKYTVTVTVTDNGAGQLVAAKSYALDDSEQDSMTFENTYLAAAADPVILTGTKHLNGRPVEYPMEAGEFSFTLTAVNGAPMPTGFTTSQTVDNEADGTFQFGQIVFDAAGVYTYTVTEEEGTVGGVRYDQTKHTVTITVTDIGGKLKAEVTGGAPTDLVFTNTYSASPVDVDVTGDKTLTNITGGINQNMDFGKGDFSFNITGPNVNETVEVQDDGSFSFTKLHFTSTGTYTFTVSEVAGSKSYIQYDDTRYTVAITVTDDGEGHLNASATVNTIAVDIDKIDLGFENKYKAEAATNVVIKAEKELLDITSGGSVAMTPKDGDFSFTLKDSTGAPVETVSNKGKDVTFTGLDFGKVGVYTYTISEVKGELAGMTYSEASIGVTVTVTDNGKGQLEAEVTYANNSNKITNTFKAADATLILAGKKTLTGGRELKAEEFSFNLKGEGVDETVKNAADGSFQFTALRYDTVGIYTYEITEVKGSDALVKYDDTKYTVTVTVTYENGVMKAEATVGGQSKDTYGFTNSFTPKDLTIDLHVQKVLKGTAGTDLTPAGFQFQLIGSDKTATSDAQGDAVFAMTYTALDIGHTYTYKFSEIKGDVAGVIYDTSVQEIKVTISQDSTTGELKATVEGTAVFTNIYEQPPKTADNFNLNGWVLMMSVSAVCLMAVVVLGRKKLAA